jgi:hypothetical protein
MKIEIPDALHLAKQVESLENDANQKIIAEVVGLLENCKKTLSRSVQYSGSLSLPVQKALKDSGYKVEYYSDYRERDDSYWTISF